MPTYKVIREATAWDLIGHESSEGMIRIKGGRAVYEDLMFNCSTPGNNVLLARLEKMPDMRLRQINRYVEPDTVLEVLEECEDEPEPEEDPIAWIKPGHAYKKYINDLNPNNATLHVRAIVDDEWVVAAVSNRHFGWSYKIEHVTFWLDMRECGWITDTGKSQVGLPEISDIDTS